ncbi:FadR/GntR family transcriptional regulator [Planktotalea sp.]|uniref:FadR/GntR family transcriptional regulator n=1 Tax=Planktotalea sp. TaxID=2029877 RepID=UPI003D6A7E22
MKPIQSSLFDPIEHGSVSDAIVNRVEEMITSGVLKSGARLPSERSLAEALQVSRPKVREALQELELSGLIQVRHGEGSFVAPLVGEAISPALVNLYARQKGAFANYLEFRHEQECFAASLAAQRATEDDISIIRAIVEQMEQAHLSNDSDAARKLDAQFHIAIVDASHNFLLIHTMASVYALMQQDVFYSRTFLSALDGSSEALLTQHRAIAEAIYARAPDRAADATSAHIQFVAQAFNLSIAQGERERNARRRRALIELTR